MPPLAKSREFHVLGASTERHQDEVRLRVLTEDGGTILIFPIGLALVVGDQLANRVVAPEIPVEFRKSSRIPAETLAKYRAAFADWYERRCATQQDAAAKHGVGFTNFASWAKEARERGEIPYGRLPPRPATPAANGATL